MIGPSRHGPSHRALCSGRPASMLSVSQNSLQTDQDRDLSCGLAHSFPHFQSLKYQIFLHLFQ
uniref:Uncharacterized protein n=1 Tax=Arundo donax TaxID=35708 RepID=A0A0A9E9U6_ARUDO